MPSSDGDRYCRPVFAPLHGRYKLITALIPAPGRLR